MYCQMTELRPSVVFINVSRNDITSQTQPRDIYDRMVTITNGIQDAGKATIFIDEIMAIDDFSKNPNQ